MSELSKLICTVCGASGIIADADNKGGKCKYCDTVYRFKEEKGPALVLAMNTAAGYLNRHDFDNAIVHYESILKEYPNDAEAAWGHAISTYGIVYARDDRTQKMIPTCSRIVKESILENTSYLLAISKCADEQKAIYKDSATFIDVIQKRIKRTMENEEEFDVFISFKAKDDNGIATEDSVIARNIYDELTKHGIKTFFSEVTLKNRIGDEYEPIIYRALYSCKFFILIATKDEYIEAPWVKNEWTRFRDRVADEGLHNAASLVFKNVSPYSLPRIFQTQGVELEKHPYDYAQLVADNLATKFGLNNKEKEAFEEKQRKMEEEIAKLKAENKKASQPLYGAKDALNSALDSLKQNEKVKSAISNVKSEIKNIKTNIAQHQPSAQAQTARPSSQTAVERKYDVNDKDKIMMAIICIFLGAFGAHCFLLGEKKKAIFRIIMTCFGGIGSIVAFIDFIKIVTGTYTVDPNKLF